MTAIFIFEFCAFCFTDESSDDEEYQIANELRTVANNTDGNNESSDNELDMETSVNWRDNLAQKARNAYLERQSNTQNLMKMVYGAINAVSSQWPFHFCFSSTVVRTKSFYQNLFYVLCFNRKSKKNDLKKMAIVIQMMRESLVECSM